MMAHIKKYKSHYLLALVISLFWAGIIFAMPSIMQVRGVSFWQCGNGEVEGTEVCDDGDTTNFGTCNSICTALTQCGDGALQNPDGAGVAEQCDDGNLSNLDGCSSACQIESPVCGNARVETGEGCDDGNVLDGDGCSATCAIEVPAPVCGNGRLEDSEACDDGNVLDGDGCSAICQTETPLPVCGNNTVDTGEVCDDGNTTAEGTCDATCSALTACGDGTTQNPDGAGVAEQCDDGNQENTDSCLNSCAPAQCGDGFVLLGTEACDDGNTVSGDGCSATCAIEPPACVEPSIKIIFNRMEIVNAPSWKNQVASDNKTFALTGNFVVIPFSQVQKFDSNLRNAFQIGWEGESQEKHLRIGSMKQVALNPKSKLNYGIELDYTVEFLGDVNMTRFNRMTLEARKDLIVFNDGKIVYNGDRADGTHFLTGNGPADDWSKYYLTFKGCDKDLNPKPICDRQHGWDPLRYRYLPGFRGNCERGHY